MVYGNQANLDKTLSQFPHSYCKQHYTEYIYIFEYKEYKYSMADFNQIS